MTATTDFQSIPVIDIAPLYQPDMAGARTVAGEIKRASIDIGFFYVKGHTVPLDLMRATLMAAKYFFAQPEASKRAIQINQAHRGYVPFAQTTLGRQYKADLKESFNYAFPFSPDDPEVKAGKPLIGVNQWPPGEDAWRGTIEDYYRQVFEVGQRVLEGFALALDAPRDFFRGLYRRPLVRTRLLHYPPQPEGADADQFGAAPHTDWGCMTVLWQDSVGGLQVKNRAGDWIDAPYIEGSFVINIGDMLERWSNDLFVSTPHRVVNASGRERYSIPMFYDPDFDTVVECLPNCSGPANPPKYPRTIAGDYITSKYDEAYAYRKQPAA